MIPLSPYSLIITNDFNQDILFKNSWLVILHASRVPPHIGILINGNYNSLTIKGHELNIDVAILLKTIKQKKIETLFVQLKNHPVFSLDYQKDICQYYIQQFTQVKANESSCLSPIKLFLQEFYAVSENKNELLFELIERLKQNQYIMLTLSVNINIKNDHFSLPYYSNNQLQDVIKTEYLNYFKE